MGYKVLTIFAVLFVAVSASYMAAVKVDGPEALVAELQRAANDRDVESFLSYLTAESRRAVEASYAESVSVRNAQAEFEKVLDEKFGKGTEWIADAEPADDLNTTITRISRVELLSKTETADGSVTLKVRTTIKTDGDRTTSFEETVGARQENGEWKLSLGFPETSFDSERIKKDIERIIGEVRTGKYDDRVAAMIAVDNAMRREEVK